MIAQILQLLTMALMLAALFLMESGYGLHISLLGLFVCMATCSRSTIGAFCLIYGGPVLGYIAGEIGYMGWGGDVIIAVGLVLLHSRYPLQKAFADCKNGINLLLWCTFVLLFFYIYGQQNSYAVSLMIGFVKSGFLAFVAFFFIFRDRSVDWQRLGLLGIFSGLIYLAFAGRIDPGILPNSVLDIGRVCILKSGESHLYTHLLAFLPVLGFMFVYSKDVAKVKTRKDITILIISLFTTGILVGWSGARQGIAFLLIGMLSIMIVDPKVRRRQYIIPVTAVILLSVIIIHIGISQDFRSYTVLADSDRTLYQKLNRDRNFDTALWLFKEKPFLGHGLGGYYIPGHSSAGDRVFAHNVILDLLVQTGLIGALAFFSPLLLSRSFRSRIQFIVRSVNGNNIMPVFCVFVLKLMVDSQLGYVGTIMGLLVALPALTRTEPLSTMGVIGLRPTADTSVAQSPRAFASRAKRLR